MFYLIFHTTQRKLELSGKLFIKYEKTRQTTDIRYAKTTSFGQIDDYLYRLF